MGENEATNTDAPAQRVDFYVLDARDERAVTLFTCRLAEKAWRAGHAVWIHTDSSDAARLVDSSLWTFRDESFVPHAIAGRDDHDTPILIGCGDPPEQPPEVLINLGREVPGFAARCARIAEIVGADERARAAGRERFRTYRGLGVEPTSHRIESVR